MQPGMPQRVYADFCTHWRLPFAYQLLVALLGAVALAPLAGWATNSVVARSGSALVSNFDIARFVLSPWGAIFVLLTAALATAYLLAQFAGLTWIAGHAIARRPLTLRNTIRAVLVRQPQLVRLGVRLFVRLAVLAVPFLAVAALVWVATLRGHDINYYLAQTPPEWTRALLAVAALGAGYAVVAIRQATLWLYAIPLVMFENAGAPQALARSEALLRGRLMTALLPLGAWWLSIALLAIASAWLGRQLTQPAFAWAGIDVYRVLPLVAVCLVVTVVAGFVFSTLQLAGHQFIVTRLFAEQQVSHVDLPATEPADAVVDRQARPLLVGSAALLLLAVLTGALLWARLDLKEDVVITAHRGVAQSAPENSLAAFRAAAAAGAHYVELDVQRARDGTIVVVHDADLMRMAGDPRRIRDLTAAEFATIALSGKDGTVYPAESVPTLEQVIDMVRGELRVNVELKYNVPDAQLAPAVIELLRRKDFMDQVVITSLDAAALKQVEAIAPELPTGLIVTAAVGDVTRTEADFLSLNSARATRTLISRAQAAGKQVHVWTVNDPEVMLRMLERDVDNIITDDPALLVRVLRERSALSVAEQLGLRLRILFSHPPPELSQASAVPPL
jgi:glycerophosphoryl diester phosphodiesterase